MTTKQPLHEQIYAQLSQALMAGDFAPGEHLTIRAMAEDLGTSMMPVREAVRRLSALKALEVLPKRHVRVTPLTIGAFIEVAEMRKLLEGRATTLACQKISREELREIKRINKQLLAASAKPPQRQMMKLNHQFHLEIYRCAHSELLLETIEHLWLRIGPYLNYILLKELQKQVSPTGAFEHHGELIQALEKRNSEQAAIALHADIDEGTNQLLKAVKIEYKFNQLTLIEGDSNPPRRSAQKKTKRQMKKVMK
jgi:DNA-binding GntR family transcriptional regulator